MPATVERRHPQYQLRTVFLRVPAGDWQDVSRGRIEEFRAAIGNAPQLWHVPVPTLAVCYRRTRTAFDFRLMKLLEVRTEMLGAITEEGLARTGYRGKDAYDRFVRDWTLREKRRFEPQRKVQVFRVTPFEFTYDELERLGYVVIDHLYRDFIPDEHRRRWRQELLGEQS